MMRTRLSVALLVVGLGTYLPGTTSPRHAAPAALDRMGWIPANRPHWRTAAIIIGQSSIWAAGAAAFARLAARVAHHPAGPARSLLGRWFPSFHPWEIRLAVWGHSGRDLVDAPTAWDDGRGLIPLEFSVPAKLEYGP